MTIVVGKKLAAKDEEVETITTSKRKKNLGNEPGEIKKKKKKKKLSEHPILMEGFPLLTSANPYLDEIK